MDIAPPPFDWIIADVIAKGMKGDLNAKSKQCKSFFGMQLAIAVATGRPFLNMNIPQARKVLYANLELIDRGVWERGAAMQAAMEATPAKGMFYIMNLRGCADKLRAAEDALVSEINRLDIDLVILDPRYKLITSNEDENTAAGLRGVLGFRDALAKAAAVLMIGHDPKGESGGKSMADRGAGSYIAGADYDFSFALSPHIEEGYSVLSTSCRYRKSPADLTIRFDGDRQIFEANPDMPATIKNGRTPNGDKGRASVVKSQQDAQNLTALENAIRRYVSANEIMGKGTFDIEIGKLPEAQAIGEKRRDKVIKSLFEKGIIRQTSKWEIGNDGKKRKLGGKHYMVGAPDKVKRYEDEFRTEVAFKSAPAHP